MSDYTVTGSIVTFNNMSTIEATLRTVREQTKGVPFHLYVIDNSSRDGTAAFVKNIDPLAEVLHIHWNVGFGAGHNVVLSRLKSKYHAVINPDIELGEDAITAMALYMDEHPDVVMLSPRIVFPESQEDQILGKRNPRLRYLIASRLRHGNLAKKILAEYAMQDQMASGRPFEIENATGCFMLIRTEALQKIGGFDERYFLYFEDCDITRTLAKEGKVLYYPDAVVRHVWKRESKKNLRLMLIQIDSMFKYFWKWRKGKEGRSNHVPERTA
ncbi:MAG: glycosyltransferase family 2 protein [Oscillospiraceae bacterium]|jgi:GT2 family glycosyltransferase|nr:glycosyltransferase family 2 protein [Oscillospiraceae bacterium]